MDKQDNRYFIETYRQVYELEHIIKQGTRTKFQAIVKNPADIKRFTWFLLKNDMSFERKPLGSGITIFFVDAAGSFFMKAN